MEGMVRFSYLDHMALSVSGVVLLYCAVAIARKWRGSFCATLLACVNCNPFVLYLLSIMSDFNPFKVVPPGGDQNLGPTLVAVSVSTLVMAIMAVATRAYIRRRILKTFSWDDGLIIGAVVKSTPQNQSP
jgi:hypothetical protein